MFDTLIRNGTVVDGTGRDSYVSDLGIKGGKITAIGDLSSSFAENTINAERMIVAPGFIDIHTHSDMPLLADPRAESQIRQGVTTEVIGNCGLSLAPCTDESRESMLDSKGYPELDTWNSYGELLEVMDKANIATNVVGLVGHGALRSVVMGLQAPRTATGEEVTEMVSLLEQSLEEGAFGMSTGLEYHPGKMAGFDELAALCRAVAKVNGFYATHSRNRDKRYFVGFGEAMDLARVSGVRLQISHVNPKYGRPEHAMRNTLQMIEWAREEGVDVAMDMMPTNWNFTSAMAQLPAWAYALPKNEFIDLLKSAEGRERLKVNPLPMWQLVVEERWEKIKLMSSFANKQYISWTIEEIAKEKGSTGWDVIFDLLLEEGDQHQGMVLTSEAFAEEDNQLALSSALCAIGSDTMALANDGVLKGRQLGYSGYNWTAKYMTQYLRDGKVIGLEEGIRRLTSLPASRIGLTDRGRLIPGAAADIVVFDLSRIKDNSSFTDPNVYAGGYEHVMVNGVFALNSGKRTPDHAGLVLRRN
ncbi:MAG: D-aminoacylase [SAR324 cluster bacterium]|nr:D-aminoacylase [SAR324 cluster bacterium]